MGCVYIALSKTTDKVYVGYTSKTLDERVTKHRNNYRRECYNHIHFCKALKKYGWDDFEWITIYESDDIEELKRREHAAILIYEHG
jgi:hypothetical protein